MAKKEIEFDTERIVEKVYSIKELHKIHRSMEVQEQQQSIKSLNYLINMNL